MSFPIVGIGASAGGLESFSELIAHVPAGTGMAYVFVQHLDPSHGSLLVEILSKRAGFPVEEAREGVKILPDHLYVIAPNTTLTIGGDVLHLRSRDPAERPHHPVDTLFHSLAEQRGPNAIGIILSGNGSDGAGREFCSLFWNAGQRHQNGMRSFYFSPSGDCAGTNTHQSSLKGSRRRLAGNLIGTGILQP
jgi:chemotaxis response regulator CheB